MERTTNIKLAKDIMGKNFIGLNNLHLIKEKMGIYIPDEVEKLLPPINIEKGKLEDTRGECILILLMPYYKDKTPLSIMKMREHFGYDPSVSEPCFYNQDWYCKETFANRQINDAGWYLINKKPYDHFRGKNLDDILNYGNISLPSASVLIYSFFLWYIATSEILWEEDFIWCQDKDKNGDQIYIGQYTDPLRLNKNGLEIHRHLKIKNNYSTVEVTNS